MENKQTNKTIKLGVWGSAGDSLPLTDQVRAVLPDASSVVDQLPNLGSYGDAVKSAWNSGISAPTGSIVAIPGAIGRGLSSVKNSIFGNKADRHKSRALTLAYCDTYLL